MFLDYLYWQYVWGPRWLLRFYWNLQRALVHFFSVSLMLRTLFAFWHKDSVSYRAGSVTGILQAIAWNMISRAIGFLIRATVLLIWLVAEVFFLVGTVLSFCLFVAWPFLALGAILFGLYLINYGR